LKNAKIKVSIILSAILVAVVSLSLNVILFDRTLSYYKALNLLKLDPTEINKLKDISGGGAKKEYRTVILFGDSRIANWRPDINLPGWQVINRGIRGQTTEQLIL
jgi:hypothetical protein